LSRGGERESVMVCTGTVIEQTNAMASKRSERIFFSKLRMTTVHSFSDIP
jgi:hypothetical protein